MSIRQLFFVTSLTASCCLPAGAQSVPAVTGTLSLAQALQAAQNNLDVSLARRAFEAARGDVTAADRAPTPVLTSKAASINLQNGIGGGNLLRDKRIEKAIGVDWTYERGNKRELRTQAAKSLAGAAESDVEDIKVQQQIATAVAYFDVLALQERISEVAAIARSAAQLAATAQRRVQAGDLPALDAARIEIEAQRAATDLTSAQIDRQRAILVLAQYTGSNNPAAISVQADWPVLQDLPTDAVYPFIETRADVRSALQRVEAARALLDTASAQRSRDLTLGTSFTHFPGTSTRQLEFRLQMPLNGFLGSYNFQGEIARAQAQLNQAEDALEKIRRLATADYQKLQQDRFGASARALSYEATILPRARKVAEMAELAYSKGAMSLTELIDARRTLRSILIEALNARTDNAKAATAWSIRNP
ncbi:MAG: TolC family protein [Polaromonas sp.]|nr:TolC family protein [Polaromonas sp.]